MEADVEFSLGEVAPKYRAARDQLDRLQIRSGIKQYSDWPTIPQLYVKGEFVGGSDIMMEMFEAGELHQLMQDAAVTAAG